MKIITPATSFVVVTSYICKRQAAFGNLQETCIEPVRVFFARQT